MDKAITCLHIADLHFWRGELWIHKSENGFEYPVRGFPG